MKKGTKVRYFPVRGRPEHVDTTTRSEPWELGNGEVIVLVAGRTGGVSIRHLVILENDE